MLPTASQLSILCRWMTAGPSSLDPVPSGSPLADRRRRDYTLQQIRVLAERTGQQALYRKQGSGFEHRGQPLSTWMSSELKHAMYRECRYEGYILRGGAGVVPLTAMQVRVLNLTAQGYNAPSAAAHLGLSSFSVSSVLQRSRRSVDCESTVHLVAIAYQREWFPCGLELRMLRAAGAGK